MHAIYRNVTSSDVLLVIDSTTRILSLWFIIIGSIVIVVWMPNRIVSESLVQEDIDPPFEQPARVESAAVSINMKKTRLRIFMALSPRVDFDTLPSQGSYDLFRLDRICAIS